jgi:hypothetical protein
MRVNHEMRISVSGIAIDVSNCGVSFRLAFMLLQHTGVHGLSKSWVISFHHYAYERGHRHHYAAPVYKYSPAGWMLARAWVLHEP